MTAPHDRAAKTEKYRGSGGIGFTTDPDTPAGAFEYGLPARGMNEAMTRDTT